MRKKIDFPRLILLQILLLSITVWSCPDQDERCQSCDNEKCVYCVYSFPDAKGRCQVPENELEGCYSYLPDGRCQMCFYGYYRSMEGLCYELSPKTSVECFFSLNSHSYCTHCKNRMLAKFGKCTNTSPCSDSNCNICFIWDRVESCDSCIDGYFLLGADYKTAKCVLASPENKGCYFSDSEDHCLDCFEGYYFANNRCLPTPLTLMPEKSGTNGLRQIWILALLILLMTKSN